MNKPASSHYTKFMLNKIAIMGLGWLGLPLALELNKKGYKLSGSTTRSERLMELLDSGLSVRILELMQNSVKGNFKKFVTDIDVLIICIPPNSDSDYLQKIQQITKHTSSNLKVIYISSTSVYGNPDGVVKENSPTFPERSSGKWILSVEEALRAYYKSNLTILRMAGLFGPERHPGRFLSGKNELDRPKGKINLIHLNDCIQLIQLVIEQKRFGHVINGCADVHPDRQSFYQKAAHELSLPIPTFNDEQDKVGKEVSNQYSKDLLGMTYSVPNPLNWL